MDQQNSQQYEAEQQTALLEALLGNNFKAFSELLENGQVHPSYRYGKPHFATCLEIACRHPELPACFVRKLLESGVKPNVNVVIPEPIHYAARCGNAAPLHVLLSNPATRVNATDSSGHTALHAVVLGFKDDVSPEQTRGYESCIEMLMNCSLFDVNAINNNGYSALHLAANKKRHKAAASIINMSRIARRDLDVDRYLAGGRTAREALKAELPDVSLRVSTECSNIPANKKRLLEAMDLGDFPLYQRLLRRAAIKEGFDVDFWFEQPYNTRLLERACSLNSSHLAAKFVRVTLDAGAHPCSINLCSRRTPLHVTAETGHLSALKLLLQHPLVDVNVRDSKDQTPLHIAASCATSEQTLECLQLLLDAKGVDVNAENAFGKTPADVAGCDVAQEMIQLKGGQTSIVPLPSEPFDLGPAPMGIHSATDGSSDTLHSIALFDGGGDIEMRSGNQIPYKDVNEKKLFELMVQGKCVEFEELFKNMVIDDGLLKCDDFGYTFLQYACERSLRVIAKILLEKVDPNQIHVKNSRTPLMLACLQNDKDMVHILLNNKGIREIDINAVDHKQNTALHYAAKNEDMDIVFELLNHGADMLAKNMFGKYPLSVQEMETLLDKSINVKDNILPSNDDYAIIFTYKMLISQHSPGNNIEHSNGLSLQSSPAEPEHVKGNSELLGPKSYITYSETNFLHSLSMADDYAPLLKHPVITSYLRIKDDRMRTFLSLNLILCIVFVLSLNIYIILEISSLTEDSELAHSFQMCFCVSAFMCTLFMLFRETAQLILKTDLYFRNPENIFDLCLIILAVLILLQCPLGSFSRWAFTAAILLSWRDLFIVTGRHYKFSTNVQMLNTVSKNYIRFLKSYIFIIIAFSLSFYVIFLPSVNQGTKMSSSFQAVNQTDTSHQTENSTEKSEAVNFFENPLKTLLKTVIMMTGEFDANDLPFASDIWLSSIVFVLFLFFLHVVLLNLLTALAVSDEQQIRGNAEILSLISQIQLLHEVENTTFILYKLFKHCRCVAKLFEKLFLFPEKSLEEACLVVWPNKGTEARISGEQGALIKGFDCNIVNEAKCILMGHGFLSIENAVDTDNQSAFIQRIEHIERNIKLLLEKQQNLKHNKI